MLLVGLLIITHGGDAMPMIFVKCPATDQAIATGLETDTDSFKSLPRVVSSVHCPHCGTSHQWTATDAWLSDSEKGMRLVDEKDH